MNLTELRKVVNQMLELFSVREQARVALKQGFFGDIETFDSFCDAKKKHSEFSNTLERFSWGHCLETMSGTMWAKVFAYAGPTNPTADDIIREIYQLIDDKDEEMKIIDMILHYDAIYVDDIIDRLKFIATISFPTEQMTWVRYAAMRRVPETIDYYSEILQELKFLWTQVINFAIKAPDRKWMTRDDLVTALTDRMEQTKSKLEACCRRAEEYSSALAWVEEFEEQEKNPGITMDELERRCDRTDRPIF